LLVYTKEQKEEFYRTVNRSYVKSSQDLFNDNIRRIAMCFEEINKKDSKDFLFK
jgi:hypothetical protein